MSISKCRYPDKPYWDELCCPKTFSCYEPPLTSGYCIFHDSNYLNSESQNYNQNANNVRQTFYSKYENYSKNNQELLFIGYILPDLEFQDKKIEQNIYFKYATFKGSVKFQNSFILKKIDFQSAIFENDIDFRENYFYHMANFSDGKFHSQVHFYKNEFRKEANFSNSSFFKFVSFNKNVFKDDANFGYTKYHNDSHFQNIKFYKSAHFHFSEFKKTGDFDGGSFSNLLLNATKSNRLVFTGTTINMLEFHSSNVEYCDFGQSKFLDNCDFSESLFNNADFRKCHFKGYTDFSKTRFSEVDFSYSVFTTTVHFIEIQFTNNAYFNYVVFDHPKQIIFQNTNLSKTSFANTNLFELYFHDSVIFGKDKYTLFDEERLINSEKNKKDNEQNKVTLENVLDTYRSLRDVYEYRLNYEDAGQFFIKEMELRRKYKETKDGLKEKGRVEKNIFPLGLYFHLGKYGESIFRPLFGLFVIFLFSSLVWFFVLDSFVIDSKFTITTPLVNSTITTPLVNSTITTPLVNSTITTPVVNSTITTPVVNSTITTPLVNSTITTPLVNSTITTQQLDNNKEFQKAKFAIERTLSNIFQVNNNSNVFDYFIRAFAILELGILFIGLRRKFERRFRH